MRFLIMLLSLLVAPLQLFAQNLDVYWYKTFAPKCSGSGTVIEVLTSTYLTKPFALSNGAYLISKKDTANVANKRGFLNQEITLDVSQARDFSSSIKTVSDAIKIPFLENSLIGVAFSTFPPIVSMGVGVSFSTIQELVNNSFATYGLAAEFVVVGGKLQDVGHVVRTTDGKVVALRTFQYEVDVGKTVKRFVLGACTYSVNEVDPDFLAACRSDNDPEANFDFCRVRAEAIGSVGQCGGLRFDADNRTRRCAVDQKPICDPETYCSCDFDNACYSACKLNGTC